MKNLKLWIALCVAILCIGVFGSFWVMNKPNGTIVEVVQDGAVLYTLDLSKYHEPKTIEIAAEEGHNTILIENGRICISHADCPDHVCVQSGWLSSSLPIVCLPHRLVIRFSEDNGDLVDGVAKQEGVWAQKG